MLEIKEALERLEVYAKRQAKLERERRGVLSYSSVSPSLRDELAAEVEGRISDLHRRKSGVLERLVTFPPHHRRHQELLQEFHLVAPFEKSVLVMTKYPDQNANTRLDEELGDVISAVQSAIRRCSCEPRMPKTEKDYHPMLWDNVELFLLGCRRGVAIIEDRHSPELNPNVAIESGWMRGLGREVLYLMEEKFNHRRADWEGFLVRPFTWEAPKIEIRPAVHAWLGCKKKH